MKRVTLMALVALAGQPAFADHRDPVRLLDVSYQDNQYNCTRTETRIVEEFGVVNRYQYTESLPGCRPYATRYHQSYSPQQSVPTAQAPMSRAKCRNQALIGTAAGAGIAAAVSKKDAYGWSIPVGAVAGFLLGRHDCL